MPPHVRKAWRFVRPLMRWTTPLEWADWGYRNAFYPGEAPPPLPAPWRLIHGPNQYGPPYANPPTIWGSGFISAPPTGPNTGNIQGQAAFKSYPSFDAYIAAVPTALTAGQWIPNNTIDRYAQYLGYARSAFYQNYGINAQTYQHRAYPVPDIFAPPQPWWSPVEPSPLPNYRPLPNTVPKPGTQPEPHPDMIPEPFREPDVALPPYRVGPFRLPNVDPVPNIGPRFPVDEWFQTGPLPRPGQRPNPGRAPNRNAGRAPRMHEKAPPPQRENHKKYDVAHTLWRALNYFGMLTEGMDIVDAAWKALPKEARTKSFYNGKPIRPAWWKRALDVYNNYDKIDGEDFIKNLIANQLEDWFIAKQSGAQAAAQRFSGASRPTPQRAMEGDRAESDPTREQVLDFDDIVDQVWQALGL